MTDDDRSIDLRAMELIEEALDQPSGEHEAWITREAGDNEMLRDRALSLLRAERSASRSMRTGGASEAAADEPTPDRIGAYRILKTLGRGGMGAVYLGERATGDFDHKVAVKVIKPGALSETLVERFQRERQILATLSHPNIAQLFDGGETEAGDPYIVMEHVDGVPLSDWFEEHKPNLDARLAMFLQICAAVSFAHQSLIVHRDLTPSNVLVTASGQAKLIDFGISRPAEDDAAPRREGGSLTKLSLTPGYAAPERQSGGSATTLGDIYSLGKVLESLVGTNSDPDLAAIIAKAAADDPSDRYPSADALADDVERYRAGFPVPARGRGRGYVFTKFVRRHRAGVTATALAIALLLCAFGLTILAYSRAEAAREAEAARFEELRSLANYMLFDLNDRLERVVGNTEARVDLAARAQRYLSALAESPNASNQLRLEAAEGFIKLARIQGVSDEPNFGEREEAKANLATAERLLLSLDQADPRVVQALARARAYRAIIQTHGDQDQEAAARTLAAAEAALASVPESSRAVGWHEARSVMRRSQLNLADLASNIEEIERLAGLMESEISQWPEGSRDSRQAEMNRAYAAYYRAYAASMSEREAESLPMFRDTVARYQRLDAERPNDPMTLYMLTWTGFTAFPAASRLGNDAEAGEFLELAQRTVERLIAIEANDNALDTLSRNIREGRSQYLRDIGRFDEAVAMQRGVVAEHAATAARSPTANSRGTLGFSRAILGVIARDAGDRALACDSWRASAAGFIELQRNNELIGFFAEFLPGIRANVRKCEAGAPISEFGSIFL